MGVNGFAGFGLSGISFGFPAFGARVVMGLKRLPRIRKAARVGDVAKFP